MIMWYNTLKYSFLSHSNMTHRAPESGPQTYSFELQVLLEVLRDLKPGETVESVFSRTFPLMLDGVKGSKTAFLRGLLDELKLDPGMPEFKFLTTVKRLLISALTQAAKSTEQTETRLARLQILQAGIPLAPLEHDER